MKITGLTEKIREIIPALASRAKKMPETLYSLADGFLRRFPEKRRRIILAGLGGLALLFLVLIIAALFPRQRRAEESIPAGAVLTIPEEELFIPPEPDFVPAFIPEREPRGFWTLDDIRPYWTAPRAGELWEGEVKRAVDELMEGVP